MHANLTLVSLAPEDLPRVAHLKVGRDQVRFSGTVQEAFDAAEPDVDFHGIFDGDTAVGFFKLDRAYHSRYTFAQPGDLGLRAFLIDQARQGKGLGSAAAAALPAHVRFHYPATRFVWLTVNFANPSACRAYLKGGFEDTGRTWPHGDAGPQHILRLAIAASA